MSTEKDLYGKFARVERLLNRGDVRDRRDRGHDARRGQGKVLAMLRLKAEVSQKELSAMLEIRSQSLGELLSKLERKGYITRRPSETDRRVMEVRLTETGKDAAASPEPERQDIFACLNEDERVTLEGYLDRIIHSFEEDTPKHKRSGHGVSQLKIKPPGFIHGIFAELRGDDGDDE